MTDIAAIEARLAIAPLECPECGSDDVAMVPGDPRKVCADCNDIVGMELSPENADLAALVARVRELEDQCDAHQNDRRAWNRQIDGFIAAVMRLEGERDEAIARETLSAQAICGMSDHATVREARVRELEAEAVRARDAHKTAMGEVLEYATTRDRRIRELASAVARLENNLAVANLHVSTAAELDAAVEAERDALRAIIGGRVVAPTDAELDAHVMAGGWWMYCDGELPRTGWFDPHSVHVILRYATRWWPLDVSGRPCAWPVTT